MTSTGAGDKLSPAIGNDQIDSNYRPSTYKAGKLHHNFRLHHNLRLRPTILHAIVWRIGRGLVLLYSVRCTINKIIYLEAIRGCASIIVVLAHFVAAFFPSAIFGSAYKSHESWEILFATTPLSILFAGHFAVCLFFVLSGYILSLPYCGPEAKDSSGLMAAVIKRPVRLGGLVLVTVLVSLCITKLDGFYNGLASATSGSVPWLSHYFVDAPPHTLQLLRDLSTSLFSVGHSYNPPLWTIEIELWGSFMTYSLLLLFRTSNLRYVAYALTAVFVVVAGGLYHGFIFGILIADVSRSYPQWWSRMARPAVSVPLLLAGLAFASFPNYVEKQDVAHTIYSVLPWVGLKGGGYPMVGAVFFFLATLWNPRLQNVLSGRIFEYVGRISFAVYAVHFLVLCSFSSWLFVKLIPQYSYSTNCAIVAVSYLLSTFIIAHVLTCYVDEPTTKLANALARLYRRSLCPAEAARVEFKGATERKS